SFFVSSRRRHTRFSRDWSSDVCSSDLWLLVAEQSARLIKRLHDGFGHAVVKQRADGTQFTAVHALDPVADATLDTQYLRQSADRSEERRVGKECRCGWRRRG